ncbi:hypothetical protein C8J57DRAFT_1471255 [Mycena rebaudengoi]|nr:hypothetical protein C8J57DRAFT_1471255 [Mycena rebaudengoi]
MEAPSDTYDYTPTSTLAASGIVSLTQARACKAGEKSSRVAQKMEDMYDYHTGSRDVEMMICRPLHETLTFPGNCLPPGIVNFPIAQALARPDQGINLGIPVAPIAGHVAFASQRSPPDNSSRNRSAKQTPSIPPRPAPAPASVPAPIDRDTPNCGTSVIVAGRKGCAGNRGSSSAGRSQCWTIECGEDNRTEFARRGECTHLARALPWAPPKIQAQGRGGVWEKKRMGKDFRRVEFAEERGHRVFARRMGRHVGEKRRVRCRVRDLEEARVCADLAAVVLRGSSWSSPAHHSGDACAASASSVGEEGKEDEEGGAPAASSSGWWMSMAWSSSSPATAIPGAPIGLTSARSLRSAGGTGRTWMRFLTYMKCCRSESVENAEGWPVATEHIARTVPIPAPADGTPLHITTSLVHHITIPGGRAACIRVGSARESGALGTDASSSERRRGGNARAHGARKMRVPREAHVLCAEVGTLHQRVTVETQKRGMQYPVRRGFLQATRAVVAVHFVVLHHVLQQLPASLPSRKINEVGAIGPPGGIQISAPGSSLDSGTVRCGTSTAPQGAWASRGEGSAGLPDGACVGGSRAPLRPRARTSYTRAAGAASVARAHAAVTPNAHISRGHSRGCRRGRRYRRGAIAQERGSARERGRRGGEKEDVLPLRDRAVRAVNWAGVVVVWAHDAGRAAAMRVPWRQRKWMEILAYEKRWRRR